MRPIFRQRGLVLFITVLLVAALACGSGNGEENTGDTTDLEGTQQALEKTQDALESQPEPTKPPPTEPPPPRPTQPPPDEPDEPDQPEPPAAGGYDYDSLASGDIIYETDFDGTGERWEDGWSQFAIPDSNNYSAYVENGVLYTAVGDTNSTVYAFFEPLYMERGQDVRVDTAIDNVGDVRNNNISLVCRGTNRGWYEFSLTSSGLWYIWKNIGAVNSYEVLAQGGIQGYDRNVTDHELTATCIGDVLTFYIDGVQPKNASVTDTSYREGQVGVSVFASNLGGVEVEFDWFVVSKP